MFLNFLSDYYYKTKRFLLSHKRVSLLVYLVYPFMPLVKSIIKKLSEKRCTFEQNFVY